MKKNQTKSTVMKEKQEKAAPKTITQNEVKSKTKSAKEKKSLAKPDKTAKSGIKTKPAIPDLSFPEGGGNGEIVGKSRSPKKRSGKQ